MYLPNDYVVFDIETTGMSPEYAEIIEIGALKCVNNEIVDRFQTLVRPDFAIPYKITKITGISNEDVYNAPEISDVIFDFDDFVKGYAVVGHNVNFDIRFMNFYYSCFGGSFSPVYYDTLHIAKKVFREKGIEVENFKLETLKNFLDVNIISHRAIEDCEVTKIFSDYCKENI